MSAVTEGQVRVGTSEFRRINVALFCAGFVTFVTLYDVQPLLPLFAQEFRVSPAIASLPLSFSTVALALGMLIAGTASETLGRRQVMTVSLFLTSLLAVATFLSHSFESLLLLLRLLQGLVFFSAHAIASSWVGRRARTAKAQASSLYLFAYYLGSSITGTVGGMFWLNFGWNGIVAMVTLLIVTAFGVAALLLRLPVVE